MLSVLFCWAQTAPTTMNFQGRLTRLDGKPLPDGQYVVTLRLWKDLTSTNGSDLLITWQNLSVQVRSGVFSTALPNLTEAVLAGGVAYLEIEPSGQAPLSPRVPLLSVPYAVLAGTVFDGAISTQKISSDAVTPAKLDSDPESLRKISNQLLSAGQYVGVGLGSNQPLHMVDVGGNAILRGINWESGLTPASLFLGDSGHGISATRSQGVTLFTFDVPFGIVVREVTGYVGIGTQAPTAKLDVVDQGDVAIQARNLSGTGVALVARSNYVQVGPLGSHILYLGQIDNAPVVISPDHQVGIGTTNLSADLHIGGAGAANIKLHGSELVDANDQLLRIRSGGNTISFDGGDSIGIGTTNPTADLQISGSGQANIKLLGSEIIDTEDGIFRFRAGGSIISFDGGDRIGIGTTNPTNSLEVNGNAYTIGAQVVGGGLELLGNPPLIDFRFNNAPDYDFRVANTGPGVLDFANLNGTQMRITNAGRVGIGTTSPGWRLEVAGSAAKPGGGSWTDSSDRRLKTNIQPIRNPLDQLLALTGVSYDWRDPKLASARPGRHYGFIAQDVQAIFPGWVSQDAHGYLGLTLPFDFNALVVESFREQQQTIQELNSKVQHLDSKLRSQDQTIKHLMRRLDRLEGRP
ncbi:MAG: hypothetical protein HONBIEJF_02215 [Fimbriimonadaceae bacterium]|nr:hypothetical protein [Fimbriimonadaceae bacterium]